MYAKRLILILALLVIVLGGTSLYFYRNSKLLKNAVSNSVDLAEAKALAVKVGKLIVLPEDEVPTIATVSDPAALMGQSFFEGAKKGDKVLIYSNAGKAILYDPVVNKIITIAPLDTKTQKPSTNNTPPPTTEAGAQ